VENVGAAAGIVGVNRVAGETIGSKPVQDRMHELGATVASADRRSPEYLRTLVQGEIAKWGPPIKAAGISAD
jgi:tripartite-type tricarboxylate transporter receptor subunit TctC